MICPRSFTRRCYGPPGDRPLSDFTDAQGRVFRTCNPCRHAAELARHRRELRLQGLPVSDGRTCATRQLHRPETPGQAPKFAEPWMERDYRRWLAGLVELVER